MLKKIFTNFDPEADSSKFWDRLKVIIQPYWYPTQDDSRIFSEVIKSWGMLALLLFLIIGLVSFNAISSFVLRELVNVIQEKNLSEFITTLCLILVTFLMITLLTAFSRFVKEKISLDWYEWLSNYTLQKYFQNCAYYKINFDSKIENPDQRLTQEIEPITKTTVSFLATCVEKSLEMIVCFVILWQISQIIGIVVIISTLIGNVVALYLSQELNQINQEQLESQANYNYAVIHVRNHAESIAFFQGEKQELNIIQKRLRNVIKSSLKKINWQRNKDLFDRGYQSIIQIFPFLIVGPLYITDKIDFGEVNQASLLSNLFAGALSTLIGEIAASGRFSSLIERLAILSETLETVTQQPNGLNTIKTDEEDRLAFENVTLQTPNYEKVIVKDLTFEVESNQALLIVGPSGCGKSSLLRAIASLWNAGTGRLVRPERDEILFLPQRPYIILGTLREQLLYPDLEREISDGELKKILEQVNLPEVLTKVGGFDEEVPWENILSLGEQQRLAFARILVTYPQFVILDEATSALDLSNERNLYQQLEQIATTFVSVGHRESLCSYHQKVLELSGNSNWRLVDVQDYKFSEKIVDDSEADLTIDKEINIEDDVEEQQSEPEINIEDDVEEQQSESEKIVSESVTITGFSHKEMEMLSNYTLNTIRSKASRGKVVTGNDGFKYRYDKNPNVLKWVRI
ncbi:MAG: ABC transporter ATP-binding protein/permease [Okeania sp. SIO3I5]|nr:ABC transporter ATP-binding protein/permease [Okeania sp. SIO3I5]